MTVVISLYGAPKGKGRPRFVRKTGIAYTPQETRNYEAMLRSMGAQAMGKRLPFMGAVAVWMNAYFPIPESWSEAKRTRARLGQIKPTTRPDVDNIVKMLDALNGIVWADDKQVVVCRVCKSYSALPRLVITAWEMPNEDGAEYYGPPLDTGAGRLSPGAVGRSGSVGLTYCEGDGDNPRRNNRPGAPHRIAGTEEGGE